MDKYKKRTSKVKNPDCIFSYFKLELLPLIAVTVSGIIYNVGMIAGPYFEGRLTQCLFDIINKKQSYNAMLSLVIIYLFVILIVQLMRCVKRFYVRRFANNTAKNMRHMLYNSLVNMSRDELHNQGVGSVMTKAISDVDVCVEGMRKFTTEIFDTGVVLIAYISMLFYYDFRLAPISCAFTPIAYIIAGRLKRKVTKYNLDYKKSSGMLNNATMDRILGAIMYRVHGCEKMRDISYEKNLSDYEKKAVLANIWENTMQPIYNIISMSGVVFILYFGGKNVLRSGWSNWDIAAFTTFLSCFTKMALKSSKAAKLFNSVQKAQVSWARLKPLMKEYIELPTHTNIDLNSEISLTVSNLSLKQQNGAVILKNISFNAKKGEIIGVTGAVACGKSMLGKALIGEVPNEGNILINGNELSSLTIFERSELLSYQGHEPELISDTIEENICLGKDKPIDNALKAVCLNEEISQMPNGISTFVGSGGTKLSGGQQSRLALARTVYNGKNILILDDPFASVDKNTEEEIFNNLREFAKDRIVIIISHRLQLFDKLNNILFLENGECIFAPHSKLISENSEYAKLYYAQNKEGVENEK